MIAIYILIIIILCVVYYYYNTDSDSKPKKNPTVLTTPTPWKCSSAIDGVNMVASRVNKDHTVECLGNGTSCMWSKSLNDCNIVIRNAANLKIYGELYTKPDIEIINADWKYNTLHMANVTRY